MKNYIMAACCMAGAFIFTSCNSDGGGQQEGQDIEAYSVDADTTLSEEKKEFMRFAARANMLQKDLGLVAVDRAQTDAARLYGQKMIDFYNDKQDELRELAEHYNVTLPQAPDDDHLERVQDLQNTGDDDFDMEYWDKAIDAHNNAIKEYDDNIKDFEETENKLFNLWSRNTMKEKRAQMEEAMRFRLDHKDILRKRSGI